jgi:purine-cytosine permease-like protein
MAREERPKDVRPKARLVKPDAPSTPRDVAYVLIGAFVVFFTFAFGAFGLLAGIPLLTAIMAIVAVVAVIAVVKAVHNQQGPGEP